MKTPHSRSHYSNLLHSFRGRQTSLIFILAISLIGGICCSRADKQTRRIVETNATTLQIISAGDYLSELKDQGQLPGYSKNEHGKIKSDTLPLSDSPEEYPLSQTFHITKNGSSSIYHYSVSRDSMAEPWKLRRAWRTDPEGRVVEEWPIK